MKPTIRLRFVERDCYSKNGEFFQHPFKQRVLQQWWQDDSPAHVNTFTANGEWVPPGEWRDIQLEEEK